MSRNPYPPRHAAVIIVLTGIGVWSALSAEASEPEPSTCAKPSTAFSLDTTVHAAETAFLSLDVDGFSTAAEAVARSLPCASERLAPSLVARIHRLRGVQAYLADDPERAARGFAAARASDPRITIDLVPEGHALELLWGRVSLEGELIEVDPPAHGQLFLDGEAGTRRPQDRPVLTQWIDQDSPRFTTYLLPDASLPTYPISQVVGPSADARRRLRRRRIGLTVLGAGAGLALTAGALHGGAAASKANFNAQHPDWDRDDLLAARRRTNTLGQAAGVVGVAACLTSGVGLALQW